MLASGWKRWILFDEHWGILHRIYRRMLSVQQDCFCSPPPPLSTLHSVVVVGYPLSDKVAVRT